MDLEVREVLQRVTQGGLSIYELVGDSDDPEYPVKRSWSLDKWGYTMPEGEKTVGDILWLENAGVVTKEMVGTEPLDDPADTQATKYRFALTAKGQKVLGEAGG